MIENINETKSCFFEKKKDKPLARLIKKKERVQINKIRNESKDCHHVLSTVCCTWWGFAPGPCFRCVSSPIN